jgi:succinyl-diaminopimelate desuccinylase
VPSTSLDVVRLTQDLVRIKSTNPTVPETRCAEFLEEILDSHDLPFTRVPVSEGRWNVVSRLEGGGGPPLVLLAHMDTVPVGEGWSRDPYGAEIEGGRMWGRGTCDMKGGLAASLLAMVRLRDSGSRLSGDLVLALTVDEESTMTGALALTDGGYIDPTSYILAAEPSNGKLLVAQKGAVWHELRFRGISAHASMPQLGADANRAMALAIADAYRRIEAVGDDHDLLGRATLVVGVIEGGFKTNVVSDQARCEIDVRYPPSTNADEVQAAIEAAAANAAEDLPGVEYVVQRQSMDRPPVICAADSPLIKAVAAAHRSVTGKDVEQAGFRAYTDAAVCSVRSGSPHCVVYGPGQLAQAHTVDEYVDVDDLHLFEEALLATARALLAE